MFEKVQAGTLTPSTGEVCIPARRSPSISGCTYPGVFSQDDSSFDDHFGRRKGAGKGAGKGSGNGGRGSEYADTDTESARPWHNRNRGRKPRDEYDDQAGHDSGYATQDRPA